jgi:hypothetical protein
MRKIISRIVIVGNTLTPLCRFAIALFIYLALFSKTIGAGGDVEVVPGLSAAGGTQRIGFDRNLLVDPKEGPEEMSQVPRGTIQWWTRLYGNSQTLEYLSRPGILPVRHYWLRRESPITLRTMNVANVGEEKKRDPNWLPGYLQLLRNELRERRGRFTSSAISRPISSVERATYQIGILTRDGKELAGSDGHPIFWIVNLPP